MAKRKKNQRSKPGNNNNNNGSSGGPSNYNSKRPRFDNGLDAAFDAPRGYIDPSTGQRGAFPGLDDDDGEFYGPANDGLDYLKMVRSEAKGVPSLLIAGQQHQQPQLKKERPPPRQTAPPSTDELNYDDDGDEAPLNYDDSLSVKSEELIKGDDPAGWYYDGTYTAAPLPAPSPIAPQPTSLTLWHAALLPRYLSLRAAFHTSPPPPSRSLVARHLPLWRQRQYWQSHISTTKPTPGILSGMDQQTTLKVIEWLTPMLKSGRGAGKGGFVGARVKGRWTEWAWGCLVRVDECLTAEETSVLRELGKRCLEVRGRMVKLRREWDEGEEQDEEEEDDEEDYSEEYEAYEEAQEQEQEEGECSEPEPVSTVPAASDTNPAEISLDLDEESEPPITQAEREPKSELEEGEDDVPINIEPIPPSPPSDPVPLEKEKEHSYADTIGALDMVISIVGDFFGQKDLLVERESQGVAKGIEY